MLTRPDEARKVDESMTTPHQLAPEYRPPNSRSTNSTARVVGLHVSYFLVEPCHVITAEYRGT